MRKRAGSIFACLLLLSHARPQLLCQTGKPATTPPPSSAETSLLDALQNEQHAGTVLFYTQTYIDADNQRVAYSGSVYGFIKHVELKDCSLNIDFIVADRYSGVVKKQPTGSVEDDEEYSATIPLTRNTRTLSRSSKLPLLPSQLAPTHSAPPGPPALSPG